MCVVARASRCRWRLLGRLVIAGGQIAALADMTGNGAVQAVINIDRLLEFTSEEARRHEDDLAKNPSAAGALIGGSYAEELALWHQALPINHGSRGESAGVVHREQEAAFLGRP
jgi:hypothetical protein